jgi:hypothetical protein
MSTICRSLPFCPSLEILPPFFMLLNLEYLSDAMNATAFNGRRVRHCAQELKVRVFRVLPAAAAAAAMMEKNCAIIAALLCPPADVDARHGT